MTSTKHRLLERKYYHPKKNYEQLLCDCLNLCPKLTKKYGKFEWISDQSNKQPDLMTDNYSLDCKLMISETQANPHGKTTRIEVSPGVTIWQPIDTGFVLLVNACVGITKDNLQSFFAQENLDSKEQRELREEEKAVNKLFDIIDTKKNLLLFAPEVRICTDENLTEIEQFQTIHKFIDTALNGVLSYRHEVNGNLDTYIAYIIEYRGSNIKDIVVCKSEINDLEVIEEVKWDSIPKVIELSK